MLYKTLEDDRDVAKSVRILNKVLSQIKNKPKKKQRSDYANQRQPTKRFANI